MTSCHFDTFNALNTYLESQKNNHFFRGQSQENWLLNSTLARELRNETQYLPRNYIPYAPLSEWTIPNLCSYLQQFCFKWFNYEGVFTPNGGDPVFELIRHLQQEPNNPKIKGQIAAKHPTPALEFSESHHVALFFASQKEEHDGAIFLINRQNLEMRRSFEIAILEMAQKGISIPSWIYPFAQINDIKELKIKRQKPIYIFQRDLRFPIDHYLPIQKVILKREWHKEISTFLKENNISYDFIYGK